MQRFIHRSWIGNLGVSRDAIIIDGSKKECSGYDVGITSGDECIYAVPDATGYRNVWYGYGAPFVLEIPDEAFVLVSTWGYEEEFVRADQAVQTLKRMRKMHNLYGPYVDGRLYEVLIPLSIIVNYSRDEKDVAIAHMHRTNELYAFFARRTDTEFDFYLIDRDNGPVGVIPSYRGPNPACDYTYCHMPEQVVPACELLNKVEAIIADFKKSDQRHRMSRGLYRARDRQKLPQHSLVE